MISGTTAAPVSLSGGDRRLEDGAGLHLDDFRIGNRRAAAAMTEHGIEFMQRIDALAQDGRLHAHDAGDLGDLLVCLRQEFVQRRVKQADRYRQPVHDGEHAGKIEPLHRQELGERGATALLAFREDHLAHDMDAVAFEEHVLGAAKRRCPRHRRNVRRGRLPACRHWCAPSCGASDRPKP